MFTEEGPWPWYLATLLFCVNVDWLMMKSTQVRNNLFHQIVIHDWLPSVLQCDKGISGCVEAMVCIWWTFCSIGVQSKLVLSWNEPWNEEVNKTTHSEYLWLMELCTLCMAASKMYEIWCEPPGRKLHDGGSCVITVIYQVTDTNFKEYSWIYKHSSLYEAYIGMIGLE